jgi:hypothetical protein
MPPTGSLYFTVAFAAALLVTTAEPARAAEREQAPIVSAPAPTVPVEIATPDQAPTTPPKPDPPATAPAQDPAATPLKRTQSFGSALWHNLGDDLKHMPRRNTLYFLAGGGALALAAHPADNKVNRHLMGSNVANKFFAPGQYVGATYSQFAISLTTYLVGRMKDQPRVEHIGMDLIEAQILSETIVELTKVAVHRPRPRNPDGTPTANTYSFPSGHATVTFATATVLQQHFGWKAAVPTYALATYVATSRLHDNRHYLSDVVFGAAVGIVIGRSVTWHGRNTYTIATGLVPGGLGALVTW